MLLSGILSISAYDFTQFYIIQNMYLAVESPKGSACELIVPIPSNTFPMRRAIAQKAFLLASKASHAQPDDAQ